jgi:DNA-binding response OmpR family regulator
MADILVIDDEVRIGRVLNRILSRDYDVTVMSEASSAASALESNLYDLVICDLRMPGISGIELYERAVGSDSKYAGRFLFLSGDLSGDQNEAFFARTGEARLGKPFELAELRERVASMLD